MGQDHHDHRLACAKADERGDADQGGNHQLVGSPLLQVAADGITVNGVAPGRINTARVLNRLFPTEEVRPGEIELDVPGGASESWKRSPR